MWSRSTTGILWKLHCQRASHFKDGRQKPEVEMIFITLDEMRKWLD